MKSYYIIIIGILCLMTGIGIGYNTKDFDMNKENILPQENKNTSALLSIADSPLLDDVTIRLRGELVQIDEGSLSIKKGDNLFVAKIGDFFLRITKINYESNGDKKLVGEDLKFEDVKIGDQLRIRCILTEEEWYLEDIVIEENFSKPQE